MSRFRVPAMLFLLLGAASLCVWGRRDWRAASGRRRAAALVCVTVMAGLVAMGYESVLRSTGG